MARNALAQPRWDFETPSVNALLQPLQQGVARYDRLTQQDTENRRADEQMGMQRERFGMEREKFGDAKAQRAKEAAGNLALLTLQESDPNKRAEKWKSFISTHPNAAGLDPRYHDPGVGPMAVLADAGMAQTYLDYQMKRAAESRAAESLNIQRNADRRAADTSAASLSQDESLPYDQRVTRAESYFPKPADRTPENARYMQYLNTGKLAQSENKALESAVAKSSVDMAENDIKAGYGAAEVIGHAKRLRELAESPGLDAAIGPIAGSPWYQTIVGGAVPFSQTIGLANPALNQQIEQTKQQVVQSAQQRLKGLGPMSDADAARVEKAVGLMERARNKKEFLNSINEVERAVQISMARAQAAAKQFPQLGSRLNVVPTSPSPQGGINQDGVKRRIGDKTYVQRNGQWFEE